MPGNRPPIDTSRLGPVRIDRTKTPEAAAMEKWWTAECRRGDPLRNTRLTSDAFHAGYAAGRAAVIAERDQPVCVPFNSTVTIDTDSEPGAWQRALGHTERKAHD